MLDLKASTGNHIVVPVAFEFREMPACTNKAIPCSRTSVVFASTQATCVDPAILPNMNPF